MSRISQRSQSDWCARDKTLMDRAGVNGSLSFAGPGLLGDTRAASAILQQPIHMNPQHQAEILRYLNNGVMRSCGKCGARERIVSSSFNLCDASDELSSIHGPLPLTKTHFLLCRQRSSEKLVDPPGTCQPSSFPCMHQLGRKQDREQTCNPEIDRNV